MRHHYHWLFIICLFCSIQSIAQNLLDKELKKSVNLEELSLEGIIHKADSLSRIKLYDQAESEYIKAFNLVRKIGNTKQVKYISFKVDFFFRETLKEYSKSLEVLTFLENYCSDIDDYDCLSYINHKKAWTYKYNNKYLKSLKCFNKTLEYEDKLKRSKLKWNAYLHRGLLFLELGDEEQARRDFRKSLKHIPSNDKYNKLGTTYLNLSASFPEEQMDSTFYYSRLSSRSCKDSRKERSCHLAYSNIAWYYVLKNEPKRALEVINNKIGIANLTPKDTDDLYPALMHTMGKINYQLEKYNTALEYYKIAHAFFYKRKDLSDLILTKEDLSKTYEKLGDFKNSLKMMREIKGVGAQKHKLDINKELVKNEARKMLEIKEGIISDLEQKNLEKERQVNKSKWSSYFLGLLLLVALVILVYRGYKSEIKYYQLNEKLTMSRLTSLRSSMNPHFLFNTFSTLQNYILKNDNVKANEYMTELSGLIRNVLKSSDSIYIDLDTELHILESYMNLQRGRYQNNFDAIIEVSESLRKYNPIIPSMVIQPFIENAIIHGFSKASKTGVLQVKMIEKKGNIICTIEDNGIGRKASEMVKQKKKESQNLSIATKNANERLEILNKVVLGQPNVVINDLFETNGDPKGTEVIITLPIIKNTNDHAIKPKMFYN